MLKRQLPAFHDLREFLLHLEREGDLVRVREDVSVVHDLAEVHRRVVAREGPALLFERPIRADGVPSDIPVLVTLFGTVRRVAAGLGCRPDALARLGEDLAELRDPRPPTGLSDTFDKLGLARAALRMRPCMTGNAMVQKLVYRGDAIDLGALPVQIPWPGEPAPLMTWPLVVTAGPDDPTGQRANVGVYRMQVLDRRRAIIRWLAHRGGAQHHRKWRASGRDMPVAVVLGADPATLLAAAMPVPEAVCELHFAGLLAGFRPRLTSCVSVPLQVPASAEIVIEGMVSPEETAPEGPYGDHTGYYNSVEEFPVMRVTAITMRHRPIYLSTFTGRPPDEPSRIGEAFNAIYLPLVKRQFPELVDLWLPPEACSYRIAIASIRKGYPGHARRLMLGLWSMLPQFTYTKMLIVVDADIDVRKWSDVMWAVSTRSDPSRDLIQVNDTPIDYLDFASPKPGLGGKLGIDATNKIGPETEREWGKVIDLDPEVAARVDEMWDRLGLPGGPA